MKEIKAFCVEFSKFSKEEIIDLHDVLVTDLGVRHHKDNIEARLAWAKHNCVKYFGVNKNNITCFASRSDTFERVLTKEDLEPFIVKQLKENNVMNNTNNTAPARPTKQTTKQLKTSNKGQKVLPKSSSLLKFIYNQSEYIVRGVTNFNIELENGKLFLKYSYHRKHQTGETSGTDKVLILNDLEKIISLVPSQTHPNKYNHKVVLNLVS